MGDPKTAGDGVACVRCGVVPAPAQPADEEDGPITTASGAS